ncbi:MAG: hypothetical protein MUC36_08435 [Planctomycetes bacterium]|nr:hypothetical protein [Planctomycetota bacterium]
MVRWLLVGIVGALLVAGLGFVWWVSTGAMRSRSLLATASLRVVDPAGAPVAGVEVRVRWNSWRGLWFYFHGNRLGPSDAAGRVDLAKLAIEPAVDANYELVAEVIGGSMTPVVLTERTELVVPATGKVVAQLVDSAGRPLHHADFATQHATLFWSGDRATAQLSADGRVEFDPVACGSELSLSVSVQGWSNRESRSELHGRIRDVRGPRISAPTRAGEVVEVAVTIPDDTPRLVAVVANVDGTPASGPLGFALQIRGDFGSSSYGAFTVHPDASGAVRFLLGPGDWRSAKGELRLTRADGAEIRHAFGASAEGSLDAGELRFDR